MELVIYTLLMVTSFWESSRKEKQAEVVFTTRLMVRKFVVNGKMES